MNGKASHSPFKDHPPMKTGLKVLHPAVSFPIDLKFPLNFSEFFFMFKPQ